MRHEDCLDILSIPPKLHEDFLPCLDNSPRRADHRNKARTFFGNTQPQCYPCHGNDFIFLEMTRRGVDRRCSLKVSSG